MFVIGMKSRIGIWRDRFGSGNASLIVAAAAVGIATGACATLLKLMIKWITATALSIPATIGEAYTTILLPVVGILLAVTYQRFVLHRDISDGISLISQRFADKNYHYTPRLILAPVIASSITLGFGGSAGSESPIASAGAAIGGNIAGKFRFSPEHMMTLIACGAGAGIAGIFKAPVGGALFVIEIFTVSLDAVAMSALFVSTTVSALTAFILSGCTVDLRFSDPEPITSAYIMAVAAAGLFLGLYSTYYAAVMRFMKKMYTGINNYWLRGIFSGLAVGLLIFTFPILYGEGYGSVQQLLACTTDKLIQSSWLSHLALSGYTATAIALVIAAAVLIVKPFATASTIDGGGVAGDYAPLLMIGSVAGFLFSTAADTIFGFHLPIADFVFLGMTGVMAGAVKAPLMAIFLTVEMTCIPSMLLPAAVVATISYITRIILNANKSTCTAIRRDPKNIYN